MRDWSKPPGEEKRKEHHAEGREREVLDVLLVTPGEGVVAMSFCGRVYVPNSWQRTLRLGNPRSEVVGPLSLESFSSGHCSEHGFGQKCQSAYCC
jgi:hypothetical protein